MTTGAVIFEIMAYSLALWLGFYLIARDPAKPRLRYAGLGLVAYALSLATHILSAYAPTPASAQLIARLHWPLLFFPVLFWLGAIIHLLPETSFRRLRLHHGWSYGLLPAAILFYLLIIFPLDGLPRQWLLMAIGLDLFLLGLSVAVLDAFDEGEVLLPDFLRSLDYATINVVLFGGLVALTMVWETGITFFMLVLLLATIAVAITTQTFADPFQAMLDRLAFAYFPRLQQARTQLRTTASVLPRMSETFDFETLDDAEFIRLTRRALSHLGDLPRLATNPLTHLPLIDSRLASRGVQAATLERAAELKTLLTESITRLKPRGQGDFGPSEAWRYYNALYFPYVLGLKPYIRRGELNGLDPVSYQALEWFQAQVPERTLHNWQNIAAKLIAQDLKEQLKQVTGSKVAE